MKTQPILACPGCGSQEATDTRLGAAPLKRCKACGMRYAPEAAEPDEIYVDGYFDGEVGDFGPGPRHPELIPYLDFVGEVRLGLLERTVQPPASLLDVGCGPGDTLNVARRRGWETVGVDLVPAAVEIARNEYGLDVRKSLLEESGLPERSFDAVMATHVLEHMADGIAFLQLLARWARPGGYLFIEVPNWRSIDRMGNGQGWYGLRPHEHLGHYSPKTLAETMRRAGLQPVSVHTPSYQYPAQTHNQALHDLGLERMAPRLRRFTEEKLQRGEPALMPKPGFWKVLGGLQWLAERAKVGVVIVMIAKVP